MLFRSPRLEENVPAARMGGRRRGPRRVPCSTHLGKQELTLERTSCGTYLLAQPPKALHAAAIAHEATFASGLAGTLFLLGYLFFDGLVSTTQERVFGKNPKSSDPFGPESPVLDQMVRCPPSLAPIARANPRTQIWTNTFAAGIALVSALLSNVSGTLLPNLRLLLATPALMWDACLLSAASAVGLILLLNTISSFVRSHLRPSVLSLTLVAGSSHLVPHHDHSPIPFDPHQRRFVISSLLQSSLTPFFGRNVWKLCLRLSPRLDGRRMGGERDLH